MKSKDCPSRVKKFINDFMQYSLLKKLLSFIWYIVFIVSMFTFFVKHDKLYLYIPTGRYMVYLEYIFLILIPIVSWYTYKKQIKNKDKCINGILDYLKGYPKIHLFFNSIFTFIIMMFIFYNIGVTTTFLNLKNDVKDIPYQVKVKSIGFKGSVACRGNMKTDFLDQLEMEHKTFFHNFIQKYHFDKICVRFSGSEQLMSVGSIVTIDVKETPWGVYVYKIP